MTHHENHEPWLQVGAPDVSQRFQPPWWSPGWCPLPLHFVADCPFFFFLHTQHSRGKKRVDLTLPRLRALDSSPLFLFFLFASRIWRREWKDAENYCRWEKCDKRTYLFTRRGFYCLRDRAKKNANLHAFLSLVISREYNRRISSRGYFINY